MYVRTLVLALLTVLVPTPGAHAQRAELQSPPRVAQRPMNDRQIICRGAAIPEGWILVDDVRSGEMCGGSNPAVLNLYNVWAIERYDNKPVGVTMNVCAVAPIPAGWVLEDVYRAKRHCGHPDDQFQANVKRIRRAR